MTEERRMTALEPDWTPDRSGLQRYVIAWVERQRAVREVVRAGRQMELEAPAVVRALAPGVLLRVELLDGSRHDVGHDAGGIFVLPVDGEPTP